MSPSRHRKRTIGTQANVTRLDEELTTQAQKWKLEESTSSSEPKRPTLTPMQMGLMGLQPDPCNPKQVLNSRPMRSDIVTIDHPPSLLLLTEDDALTPNIP